jgi:Flp pilus assembly protein TadG
MRRRSESGQVTAFVAIFMVALIGLAGLVLDGGVALSARRRAANEAQAAARAGAEMLDVNAYRNGNMNALDTAASEQAATDYMARADRGATVQTHAAGDTVTVDVSFDQPLNILGVFGVGSITARGHGSARTAHGITQENG